MSTPSNVEASRAGARAQRNRYHEYLRRNHLGAVTFHIKLPADGLHPLVEEAAATFVQHIEVMEVVSKRLVAAERGVEDAKGLDQAVLNQRLADDPQSALDGAAPTENFDAATSELVNANAMQMASEARLRQLFTALQVALRTVTPEWKLTLQEQAGKSRMALAGAIFTCERELVSLGDTLGLLELLERFERVKQAELDRVEAVVGDNFPEVRDVALLGPAIEGNRALRALVGALASVAPGMDS